VRIFFITTVKIKLRIILLKIKLHKEALLEATRDCGKLCSLYFRHQEYILEFEKISVIKMNEGHKL